VKCCYEGTLYSVNLRTQGPRPELAYNVHSMYTVHIWYMCLDWNALLEQTKCTVDGTFVLADFVPFHSERCQLNLVDMHLTFDP